MAEIHESVAGFLSALTSGLEELLAGSTVSWTPRAEETPRADLVWWSCGLSVDPESRFLAGATAETWEQIGTESSIEQVLLKAAQDRFGLEVSCTDPGPAEEPPAEWTAVTVSISLPEGVLDFVMNPELEAALGAEQIEAPPADHPMNSVDMLMGVEIPVSVLLGRTQMRMKDLLALSHGSIVELDQELSDEVEIRVSNCTVARGEVVAVDGNYGVRIVKMLPGRNQSVARTAIGDGSE